MSRKTEGTTYEKTGEILSGPNAEVTKATGKTEGSSYEKTGEVLSGPNAEVTKAAGKTEVKRPGASKIDSISEPRFKNLKKYMDTHPELKLDHSSTQALQASVNRALDSMKKEGEAAHGMIWNDNDKIALTTAARTEMTSYLSERNAQVAAENARIALEKANGEKSKNPGVIGGIKVTETQKQTIGTSQSSGSKGIK